MRDANGSVLRNSEDSRLFRTHDDGLILIERDRLFCATLGVLSGDRRVFVRKWLISHNGPHAQPAQFP